MSRINDRLQDSAGCGPGIAAAPAAVVVAVSKPVSPELALLEFVTTFVEESPGVVTSDGA
jgi:hypothetical protein